MSFVCYFAPLQICETTSIMGNCKWLFHWLILYIILIFVSKGTHHLWSVPVLSFQDITYHFRVSLSVSKLGLQNMKGSFVLLDPIIVVLSLNKVNDWLMIVISTCFSLTEWSELCHWRRNLIILRLPFSHSKQLCVRRKTMCPSAFTIRHVFPLWFHLYAVVRVLSHYCTLFLKIFIQNNYIPLSPL